MFPINFPCIFLGMPLISNKMSMFSHRFSYIFLDLLPITLMLPLMLKSWESIPLSIFSTLIFYVSLSLLSSIHYCLSAELGLHLSQHHSLPKSSSGGQYSHLSDCAMWLIFAYMLINLANALKINLNCPHDIIRIQ